MIDGALAFAEVKPRTPTGRPLQAGKGEKMMYQKLLHMDAPVSNFAICQAHQQLEADYNQGGILWERPSNRRRIESTGCQLARIKYRSNFYWVDIENPGEDEDSEDQDVRGIYILNVLKWGLPISKGLAAAIKGRFCLDWLTTYFPDWEERIEK